MTECTPLVISCRQTRQGAVHTFARSTTQSCAPVFCFAMGSASMRRMCAPVNTSAAVGVMVVFHRPAAWEVALAVAARRLHSISHTG